MKQNFSRITVIIAVLNNVSTLKRCLKSIIDQEYINKEIIVIDGGSSDGSLAVLNSYAHHFTYWESSPDRGIYHAWNKALKHAQGEWICFLGADDYFWDKRVLSNIAFYLKKAINEKINLVYGQIARVNEQGHIVRLAGKQWHKIKWQMSHGMPLDLPHPGLMHHRSIFTKHGVFDESFKIAGDYDLLLRELKTGKALFAKNIRTVACQIGGIADSSNMLSHIEVKRAREKNGYKHFSFIWFLVYIRSLFRKVINPGRYDV